MNWLWVIIGAIAGALMLQQSGGLLLGAILGAMASRLSTSRRSERAFEKRLRELEQKLVKLERDSLRQAEFRRLEAVQGEVECSEPVAPAPRAEPSLPPDLDDDALTAQALAAPTVEPAHTPAK